jgi:PIN domain nuclease of toxin-antitoxin system
MSLLEIALLAGDSKLKLRLDEFFDAVQANPIFQVLPVTYEIASEFASLRSLRDPSDRAIVATARVHRLWLVTSDERIIDSRLVPVVD